LRLAPKPFDSPQPFHHFLPAARGGGCGGGKGLLTPRDRARRRDTPRRRAQPRRTRLPARLQDRMSTCPMDAVIVESPAKAKTINKYLGKGYKVLASYGHVRDLPSKDGSVRPDEDFAMAWDVDAKSQKRLNEIAAAVKGADRLILATDPDREG